MKYSRLSRIKRCQILRCFCEDITASSTAVIVSVNRKTVNAYYNEFRKAIFHQSLKESIQETGEFELDESYFGAKRIRGKRGRGAAGKTPVFGLLKRGGKVFVSIVPDCTKEALMPIIKGQILEGATIHTDGWKAYDGLILNGYDHYRVYHSANEFARGKSHVNGIESFWSFAKRRLAKFNGCKPEYFMLYLKETEFRFNHRNENLFNTIKKLVNLR
jgi:transposase-like protein